MPDYLSSLGILFVMNLTYQILKNVID
jgi:hypothetical protein